jgi:hypothetical protein
MRTWCCIILLGVVLRLFAAPWQATAQRPSASAEESQHETNAESVLFWPGGDSLEGTVLSADSQHLTWKSSLFREPLQIELSALAGIRFPAAPVLSSSTPPMQICLQNGDCFEGIPTGVDEQSMAFETTVYGKLRLQKNQIRSLRRSDDFGTIFAGPDGLTGWRHPVISSWPTPPGWQEQPGGALYTARRDAVMFYPLDLPELCEIELVLSSSATPEFVFALGSQSETGFSLECRESKVLARFEKTTVSVLSLNDSQKQIHLMLFLNFRTGHVSVCSSDGKRLAELDGVKRAPAKSGLLIRSGASDLTLERLNVAFGNGTDLHELKPGECRLHLVDGTLQAGKLLEMIDAEKTNDGKTRGELEVRLQAANGTATIPLSEIRGIFMAAVSGLAAQGESIRLFGRDHSSMSGELVSISDGTVQLRHQATDQPVVLPLSAVTKMMFTGSEVVSGTPDRLFFAGGTLPGSLQLGDPQQLPENLGVKQSVGDRENGAVQNSGADLIRWKPPGGRNYASLDSSGNVRFARGSQPTTLNFDHKEFSDVLYLANNDVLPCRLKRVSQDGIEVSSPWFSAQHIPATHLRAVELQRPWSTGRVGFDDAGWTRIVGKVDHQPASLTFRASEAIGHKDVLTGDVLHFRLAWGEQVSATMMLNLFTDVPSVYPEGTAIAFECRDQTILVRDGFADAPVNAGRKSEAEGPQEVTVQGRTAEVTILRQADKVRVSVNGRLAQAFELKLKRSESRGLLIRASIVNGSRPALSGPDAAADRVTVVPPDAVRITEFEVRDLAGESIRQFIDTKARELTLTVPRFRREEPPRHVLLAPNGDLLRGELLHVDDDTLEFRSRLETMKLKRSQAAAIIWLKQQEPETAVGPETAVVSEDAASAVPQDQVAAGVTTDNPAGIRSHVHVRAVMSHGYAISLNQPSSQDGRLLGKSDVLAECRIPADSIQQVFLGQWTEFDHDRSFLRWVLQYTEDPEPPVLGDQETEGEPE